MSALSDQSQDMKRRLDEAAKWQVRLSSGGDPALWAEYRVWAAEPANRRAAEAVGRGWNAIGALASAPELLDMRQQALGRLRRAHHRPLWRDRWWQAAAVCLLLGLAGGGMVIQERLRTVDYETEIGGRRVVALPDGSHVSMDSDTAVRVRYSDTERALTLTRGRARFDVAHDTNRPFTVTAGTETVVAVGTSFDVEKLQSTVLVTLLQGQVVVKEEDGIIAARAPAKDKAPVPLAQGQQLVAAKHIQPTVRSADLQVAAAWEAGHLVFHDEPLGAVVERVNRYTEHPVSVDPAAAAIRVSGVFNAGDVGSFVSAITGYFPVQATTTGGGRILLQHRS